MNKHNRHTYQCLDACLSGPTSWVVTIGMSVSGDLSVEGYVCMGGWRRTVELLAARGVEAGDGMVVALLVRSDMRQCWSLG